MEEHQPKVPLAQLDGYRCTTSSARMLTVGVPSQIRSPLVVSLFAYWNRVRAGRITPRWSDIQPVDIKSLLPYVVVADVLERPFDVRYRIVGTAVVEAFGYDFTGETLRRPKPDPETVAWLDVYRQLVDRRGPCFAQYKVPMDLKEALVVDVGVFPLSSDGVRLDRLIELEDWQAEGGFRPRVIKPTVQDFTILPELPG
jgi:hypothetical protein